MKKLFVIFMFMMTLIITGCSSAPKQVSAVPIHIVYMGSRTNILAPDLKRREIADSGKQFRAHRKYLQEMGYEGERLSVAMEQLAGLREWQDALNIPDRDFESLVARFYPALARPPEVVVIQGCCPQETSSGQTTYAGGNDYGWTSGPGYTYTGGNQYGWTTGPGVGWSAGGSGFTTGPMTGYSQGGSGNTVGPASGYPPGGGSITVGPHTRSSAGGSPYAVSPHYGTTVGGGANTVGPAHQHQTGGGSIVGGPAMGHSSGGNPFTTGPSQGGSHGGSPQTVGPGQSQPPSGNPNTSGPASQNPRGGGAVVPGPSSQQSGGQGNSNTTGPGTQGPSGGSSGVRGPAQQNPAGGNPTAPSPRHEIPKGGVSTAPSPRTGPLGSSGNGRHSFFGPILSIFHLNAGNSLQGQQYLTQGTAVAGASGGFGGTRTERNGSERSLFGVRFTPSTLTYRETGGPASVSTTHSMGAGAFGVGQFNSGLTSGPGTR